MEQLYNYLPEKLVTFILVTLFSLLIGLSQRKISLKREEKPLFSVLTAPLRLSECWGIFCISSIRKRCTFAWEVV